MSPEPSPGADPDDSRTDPLEEQFDSFIDNLGSVVDLLYDSRVATIALEHDLQHVVKGDTRVRRLDPEAPIDQLEIEDALAMDDDNGGIENEPETAVYAIDHRTNATGPDEWESQQYLTTPTVASFLEPTVPISSLTNLIYAQQAKREDIRSYADTGTLSDDYISGVTNSSNSVERDLQDMVRYAIDALTTDLPNVDPDDLAVEWDDLENENAENAEDTEDTANENDPIHTLRRIEAGDLPIPKHRSEPIGYRDFDSPYVYTDTIAYAEESIAGRDPTTPPYPVPDDLAAHPDDTTSDAEAEIERDHDLTIEAPDEMVDLTEFFDIMTTAPTDDEDTVNGDYPYPDSKATANPNATDHPTAPLENEREREREVKDGNGNGNEPEQESEPEPEPEPESEPASDYTLGLDPELDGHGPRRD